MVSEDSSSGAPNSLKMMESSIAQGIQEQKEFEQKQWTILTKEEEMLSKTAKHSNMSVSNSTFEQSNFGFTLKPSNATSPLINIDLRDQKAKTFDP